MELLYAGVDTFDFAITGALTARDLNRLQTAKEIAIAFQAPALTEIGPGRVSIQVFEHGRRGGYAYVFHTGPLGAIYAFKENPDPNQWNGFVSLRASALAAYGFSNAREHILEQLRAMGCTVGQVSIARIDYAMDFLASNFVLNPAQFVAHPHTRLRPEWSKKELGDEFHPTPILRGRTVESVTIGKMPGRQVIVYDKRRAVIEKSEKFWFEVWKLDPKDSNAQIWRVEARAGKRELKERWNIRTFEDLDAALGDVTRETLSSIRYLASTQTDSNVTRQVLDPLWVAATDAAAGNLSSNTSGILPGRIVEIERARALEIYRKQIAGNAAGLAAALGIKDEDLQCDLPERVRAFLSSQLRLPKGQMRRGVARAKDRLHFVNSREED